MSLLSRHPRLRWIVPLVAAVLLTAGGSAVGVIAAAAHGSLPDRTASQLLVDVQKAKLAGLSGTIVENADLGVPSLPGVTGGGSSDLTSLVSGSHTLRLWYADPEHVRLSLLGSLGESDVIRNGSDLWTWASTDKSATHRTLPESGTGAGADTSGALGGAAAGSGGAAMTPQQLADAALKAIDPTTKVSSGDTTTVAGRSAYVLVLEPRDSGSLVGSVQIAIDSSTHLPLQVQVFAKGASSPSLDVGFTSFDPSTTDPSVFGWNPPAGTKVTESASPGGPAEHSSEGPTAGRSNAQLNAQPNVQPNVQPTVVGKGWTSVVVVDAGSAVTGQSSALTSALKALPTVSGAWGSGHLLAGTLFSAVLTDDGRVAVGAVAPAVLLQALANA